MRKLLLALLALVAFGCAGNIPAPPTPIGPGRNIVRNVRVTVYGNDQELANGTALMRDDFHHEVTCQWLPQVDCVTTADFSYNIQGWLHILVDGYEPVDKPFLLTDNTEQHPFGDALVLNPSGVDPSKMPLDQLANIRGAMWTETWACDLGPRPWQPNNICATDFLWNYSEPQRLAIVQNLTRLGYTHAVVGPIVDSDGYHGSWTPNDWRTKWDQFLDMLQFLWNNGLTPVVFIHPDGWSFEQTRDQLTPLLQQDRAQKLIRIVVPHGWEPCKYECSSYTWAAYGQWVAQVLPNSLRLLHTVCDVDAPVGTDNRGDDNGHPNAEGWQRVAPFYHGWLTQTCTWSNPDGHDDPNHPDKTNYQNWLDLFNPNIRGSYTDRFMHGYAGWPTSSAWGTGHGIDVYAGEDQAYKVFWQHGTKEEARKWGDDAMRAGARGYLDGGTVSVPLR